MFDKLSNHITRREINAAFIGLAVGGVIGGFAGYERAIRIFSLYSARQTEYTVPDDLANSQVPYPEAKKEGDPAPDFELLDFKGKQHRLADYKGTPIIISFLDYWNTPSKMQAPSLEGIASEYKSEIKVFAMMDSDFEEFFKNNANGHLIPLLDSNSHVNRQYHGLDFNSPVTYLINARGTIVFVQEGPADFMDNNSTARKKLEVLLRSKP